MNPDDYVELYERPEAMKHMVGKQVEFLEKMSMREDHDGMEFAYFQLLSQMFMMNEYSDIYQKLLKLFDNGFVSSRRDISEGFQHLLSFKKALRDLEAAENRKFN